MGIVEKPGHRESLPGTTGLWPIWGRGAPSSYCAHELPGGLVEMQLLTERSAVGPEIQNFSGNANAAGPSIALGAGSS